MDFTAFSAIPGVVTAIAPLLVVLGLVWVWWRTESRHVLIYRLWRLVHGNQEIVDPEVNAYVSEQTSLMSFRFISGVPVKNLDRAHELLLWAKSNDVEIATIASCGDFFDTDLRQVREQKLPSALTQGAKAVGVLIAIIAAAVCVASTPAQSALLQFKANDHWFLMNKEGARTIWSSESAAVTKNDCSMNPNATPKRTGFSEAEVDALCKVFADDDLALFIQDAIKTQTYLLLGLAALFSFLFAAGLISCRKAHVAIHLAARRLSPEVAGGQASFEFENMNGLGT